MLFAQLTFRERLRDIEACLRGSYHLHAMGVRGNIARTNLAYANRHRDWRVYEALAHVLIRKARRLHADNTNGLDIDEMVYAVDASTIDFCLSMFPWARFKKTKAATKLHTQIDPTGSIPVFISLIELFFKWIKQNLRIKVIYGTSRNAVYTQIWIGVSTYLMAVSTHNQALNALVFLYREVLRVEVEGIEKARSARPKRLPVVLTVGESKALPGAMSGTEGLMARLWSTRAW